MIKHTEEFKREAVRIALTSGLPRERSGSHRIWVSVNRRWASGYRNIGLLT